MVETLPFLLAVMATVLGATASVFFKLASRKVHKLTAFLHNMDFFIGAFLFVVSTFFMIAALKFGDLSKIFPLTALTYVWVAILSVKVLKEKMTVLKIAGFAIIVVGIIFVGI